MLKLWNWWQKRKIERRVINWFATGAVGASSKSIAFAGVGGIIPRYGWDFPHDPDDFSRCFALLKAIPELRKPAFKRLQEEGGAVWRKYIKNWDLIYECMDEEVGWDWSKGRSAPVTYGFIQKVRQDG